MANLDDLLGSFMQHGLSRSGADRIGNILNDLQAHAGADAGSSVGGHEGSGGVLDKVLAVARSTLDSASHNPAQVAGLGAVLGSLWGGGGRAVSGALKGGALALLAGVAYKALSAGGQGAQGEVPPLVSGGAPPGGMPVAWTPAEQQVALDRTAELILRGMLNAAKADGAVTPEEVLRILGKLKEAGLERDGEDWIMAELRRPLDLAAFAAAIPNQEVAAQVYAASLLAVEVDTPQERAYLADLARQTGLDATVVRAIHQSVGVPL